MYVNLNQLRAFYTAARNRSMAAAADRLHVSPPAITMQIKKLEEWLGFPLFCRSRPGLELTEQGQTLYTLAATVFDNVEHLERQVEEMVGKRERELLFGTYHIPARYVMPHLLAHARRTCPGLRIRMTLGTQEESLERLRRRDLDVALLVSPPPLPRIKTVLLCRETVPLVVAADSSLCEREVIDVRELGRLPLILQQRGTGFVQAVRDYLQQHGVAPCIAMEDLSSDIVKQFLLQDEGAAFITRFAIQKELDEGTLREIRIAEGGPTIEFSLAYLDQQYLSPGLQQFLDSLSEFSVQHLVAHPS